MLRNYLTVGFRALAKNRTYAAINILGLAIGMAACVLILLFVRYEFSYDRWLPGAENAYQFQASQTDRDTGVRVDLQMAPYTARTALAKDFPEIDKIAYATNERGVVLKDGQPVPDPFLIAERDFFAIFPVAFLRGSAATSLRDVNSVALAKSKAVKYFGSEDAVGRMLTIVDKGVKRSLRVSGVFADLPKNSHQDFAMVRLFDPMSFTGADAGELTRWGWTSGWVYFTLKPGIDPAAIEARLPAWQERNVPKENVGGELRRQDDGSRYYLTRLPDIHLGRAQQGSQTPGNDSGTITTFAIIGLLVLGMAAVNFTNLATARASLRAREVSLRKVLGATRRQIILQFLSEAVLVAGIAMLLALAMVELILPWLAHFLDADLQMRYFGHDGLLPWIMLLTVSVGIASGAYPAFRVSAFRPAAVLRTNRSSEGSGGAMLRNVLVIGQFAISIGLIICTITIYAQTVFAKQADPGFQRTGLLQVDNLGTVAARPLAKTFEAEVRHIPGVAGAARTAIGVETDNRSFNSVVIPGQTRSISLGNYSIEPGFFEAVGLKTLAGRTLSDTNGLDDATMADPDGAADQQALAARGLNVVVSRLAAKRLGFDQPEEAIGKHFGDSLIDSKYGAVPCTIVGVVEDARWHSVHEAVDPIVYYQDKSRYHYLEVRFAAADPAKVREAVAQVWMRLLPLTPFVADFADARAARQYREDDARATLFACFAGLSVIIGCLGLFGLASFTAERRTKEIGIRKVLGARTRDIVRLLVWQFSRPVLMANLIAWPVAWWVMRDWLNRFDARIALGPAPFLLAGGLAFAIAVATIAGHAFRVARANPIMALRYE